MLTAVFYKFIPTKNETCSKTQVPSMGEARDLLAHVLVETTLIIERVTTTNYITLIIIVPPLLVATRVNRFDCARRLRTLRRISWALAPPECFGFSTILITYNCRIKSKLFKQMVYSFFFKFFLSRQASQQM